MSKADLITKEIVDESLDYDKETGVFTWKSKGNVNAYKGKVAGTMDRGYIFIFIKGVKMPAHRLAWLTVYGSLPKKSEFVVDHINRDRTDNRITNLRVISYQENSANTTKARTTSALGVLGVTYKYGKYYARLVSAGKFFHLGGHKTLDEAVIAYESAKARLNPTAVIA